MLGTIRSNSKEAPWPATGATTKSTAGGNRSANTGIAPGPLSAPVALLYLIARRMGEQPLAGNGLADRQLAKITGEPVSAITVARSGPLAHRDEMLEESNPRRDRRGRRAIPATPPSPPLVGHRSPYRCTAGAAA